MTEPVTEAGPICLTDDEVESLRQLLAFLAVLDQRGFDNDLRLLTITRETWRDMVLRPAQGLRRVTTPKIEARNE